MALRGPAEAPIGHWRLPFINTSINNNQNAGPSAWFIRVKNSITLRGVARARYDCQGDISFAMNHGTGRNNSALPHCNRVTLFARSFIAFSSVSLYFCFSQSFSEVKCFSRAFLGQSLDLTKSAEVTEVSTKYPFIYGWVLPTMSPSLFYIRTESQKVFYV